MMKRFGLFALLFISLLSACSDDNGPYQCKDCADQPEANPAYDNTGQGIYKGFLLGSSGTIKFDIANNSTAITAVLVIDGKSVDLTGTGTYSNGYQGNLVGSLNGGLVTLYIAVSNTGILGVNNFTIPGHDRVFFGIYKEKSNRLVRVFEGTHAGDETGTFNIAMRKFEDGTDQWQVLSTRSSDQVLKGCDGYTNEAGDFFTTNVIIGENAVTGDLDGDNIKGTWKLGGVSGTWKGRRTL